MAKQEINPYILSSLDNYVILENTDYSVAPYVAFTFGNNVGGSTVTITIEDGTSDAVILTGAPNNEISQSTFNTTGSKQMVMLSLFQCLRKNDNLFFDVIFERGVDGGVLRANIEQSKTYSIQSSSDVITISGNYSTWTPYSTSYQLYITADGDEMVMEKFNNVKDVSFNVSSPFRSIGKFPVRLYLMPMKVGKRLTSVVGLNNSLVYVLPSTVNRFYKWNYNEYLVSQVEARPRKFLTNNMLRKYNYGEPYCLSLLTEIPQVTNVTLVKKYYTNSGMYLTQQEGEVYKEINGCRMDFYDIADVESVEAQYNHSVGYFTVEAYYNGNAVSQPVRFVMEAKCGNNDVIMFVNGIGGLDSFNFNDYQRHTTSVDERYVYNINLNKDYGDTQQYERIWGSNISDQYIVGCNDMDVDTIEWLNEMKRSRYTFKFNGEVDPKFTLITIDDFTTEELDLNGKGGDVQCVYHYSDASSENVI